MNHPSCLNLIWVADEAARLAQRGLLADAAWVSPDLPLRANLSLLENIAIGLQYRLGLPSDSAQARSWGLLEQAGLETQAHQRDCDLGYSARFAGKFLRALVSEPPCIVIDRPALLLPDVPYTHWLPAFLDRLNAPDPKLPPCHVLDYTWNQPLWN